MNTTILTDRLALNVVTTGDAGFMQMLVNSPGWLQFIGDRNVHTEEDAIAYLEKILNTDKLTYWVIRLKATQEPVGIVSFMKRDYLEHFDIGFAMLPAHENNGYACEAAKAVLHLASQRPEHSIILATTLPQNVRSAGLLTRLGLHFVKEWVQGNELLHLYST